MQTKSAGNASSYDSMPQKAHALPRCVFARLLKRLENLLLHNMIIELGLESLFKLFFGFSFVSLVFHFSPRRNGIASCFEACRMNFTPFDACILTAVPPARRGDPRPKEWVSLELSSRPLFTLASVSRSRLVLSETSGNSMFSMQEDRCVPVGQKMEASRPCFAFFRPGVCFWTKTQNERDTNMA